MSYIASQNYIHGCLCIGGVILFNGNVWKLSRFRYIHRVNEVCEGWEDIMESRDGETAPEVLSSGEFSEKSDVWSFGVVMDELFQGEDITLEGTCKMSLYFAVHFEILSNIRSIDFQ